MATVSVGLIHVGTAVLKPTSTEVIAAGGTVFKVIEVCL